MKTRRDAAAAARVLADISDYLDDQAERLADSNRNRATGRIEPREILDEVARARRWARDLRRLALQEIAP